MPGLADLKISAVIKVKRHVNTGILDSRTGESHKVSVLCILSCACGYLENDGGVLFLSRLGDCLNDLHVVYVEGADCVASLISFSEHFFCCNESHNNVLS